MRVAFVENNDSFSWNVLDALPVERAQVTVVRGGRPEATRALEGAEALIIGPGPMDPERAGLLELVRAAAERRLPTLAICLGHQALGLCFGARVVRSRPAHGKRASATFTASRRFPGVVGAVEVMRYHSLSLEQVREPLEVIASLDDGTVMAVEHRTLPMAGLQFHPDSHGTPRGRELLDAFFRSLR